MSQETSTYDLQDPAFLQLPALKPPPGVTPNFTDPENKGPTLIIVGATLLTFVVILLANRAYTKIHIVRKASWDDLTIFLSALGAIVWYTSCVLQIQRGVIGRHQYELRVGDLLSKGFDIESYTINVLNAPTLWITKLTFFILYFQIFWPMEWVRNCIYFGVTLSTAFYWSVSVAVFIIASPRPKQTWASADVIQSTTKVNIAVAVGGLLVDFVLLLLPLVALHKSQLRNTHKIGPTIMFSTGLIAVAASAISIYFRYQLRYTDDKIWAGLNMELLYLIEVDAGIITACMPTFAKMLRHHRPWEKLKLRLNFNGPARPRGKFKKHLVAVCQYPRTNHYQEDRLCIDSTHSGEEAELESLQGAKDYVGHAASETSDNEVKQHGPQQA